jgi:hypothetical protein
LLLNKAGVYVDKNVMDGAERRAKKDELLQELLVQTEALGRRRNPRAICAHRKFLEVNFPKDHRWLPNPFSSPGVDRVIHSCGRTLHQKAPFYSTSVHNGAEILKGTHLCMEHIFFPHTPVYCEQMMGFALYLLRHIHKILNFIGKGLVIRGGFTQSGIWNCCKWHLTVLKTMKCIIQQDKAIQGTFFHRGSQTYCCTFMIRYCEVLGYRKTGDTHGLMTIPDDSSYKAGTLRTMMTLGTNSVASNETRENAGCGWCMFVLTRVQRDSGEDRGSF